MGRKTRRVALRSPPCERSPSRCENSYSQKKNLYIEIYQYIILIWQCTNKPNIEARSRNHCCRGKAVSITRYKRVSVALVIQHTTRMRSVKLSPVACLALPYWLCIISWKIIFSGGKKITMQQKMCVLIFSTTLVWNIPHSMKNSARYYHKCRDQHAKYPLLFSYLNRLAPELFCFNFSTACIKNVNNTWTKYVRIMKQTAFWKGEKNEEYIHRV